MDQIRSRTLSLKEGLYSYHLKVWKQEHEEGRRHQNKKHEEGSFEAEITPFHHKCIIMKHKHCDDLHSSASAQANAHPYIGVSV
jgi:hypothetical protein